MLRATTIVRRPAVKDERVADTLTLDHDARHRRRFAMTGQGGLEFLLDLDRATVIEDGDALRLEDGRLVRVEAAPERLIEVTTGNPLRLMKVAWHLGNRHVATELAADALFIAHDHVLLEMVRGLGAAAREVERPFRPERGAYEGGLDPAQHGHSQEHSHKRSDAHEHTHAHEHYPGHAHVHGPGCGHDHGPAREPAGERDHPDRHDHAHAPHRQG